VADRSTDSIDSADSPAGAQATATSAQPPAYPLYVPPHLPARVVIKPDLLPAVSVLSTVAIFGIAIGWLWSRLAPPQLVRQVSPTQRFPLTSEDYHPFDDLAVFGVLALGAGIVTAVAVWFLRERRGPVVLVAAVLGGLVAAWLAMQTGVSFGQSRFPVPGAPKVGDVFALAPKIDSAWVVVAWPFTTALVYGALAAWSNSDDLGRRLG
jgi:hypothetical protein